MMRSLLVGDASETDAKNGWRIASGGPADGRVPDGGLGPAGLRRDRGGGA
jgi:hypothetical protein